jgi:hypothetical protein
MARRTVDLPAPFGRMMHAMPCGKCAQIRMVNGFSTRRTKAAIHAAATAERSGIGHVDDGGRVDAAAQLEQIVDPAIRGEMEERHRRLALGESELSFVRK